MFIGRKHELAVLKNHYESNHFEFIGLYGRRRVGKTALLNQFVQGLPCGWCTAVEDDARLNLRILSQAVYSLYHPDDSSEFAPVYGDFQQALEAAFVYAQDKRAILVIDEFPYLAKAEPSFPSVLQAAIDRHQETSKLFIVLCGSSLSFMKEQLLDKQSPLYGRRTAQMELKPFNFFESQAFFPALDAKTGAVIYGMVGGIPLYLRQFCDTYTLEENLEHTFLTADSILYEEPANLLKQEISKSAPYNAVISAIANGASQHNDIAMKAGLETSALDYYLKELARIGLVVREEPITGKGSRKAVWKITDNLFNFWYRFIRPRQTLIERGLGSNVTTKIIDTVPLYMGSIFEQICKDWLWQQYSMSRLGFEITNIGRWWGNDPQTKSEAEIDIVAVNDDTVTLVGECKWRNELTDTKQLQKLHSHAWLAGASPLTSHWLFSMSGFTTGCKEKAQSMNNVRLISFDEMTLVN